MLRDYCSNPNYRLIFYVKSAVSGIKTQTRGIKKKNSLPSLDVIYEVLPLLPLDQTRRAILFFDRILPLVNQHCSNLLYSN